jgi:hypothetical protein
MTFDRKRLVHVASLGAHLALVSCLDASRWNAIQQLPRHDSATSLHSRV